MSLNLSLGVDWSVRFSELSLSEMAFSKSSPPLYANWHNVISSCCDTTRPCRKLMPKNCSWNSLKLVNIWLLSRKNKFRHKQKEYYDLGRKTTQFLVGDLVVVRRTQRSGQTGIAGELMATPMDWPVSNCRTNARWWQLSIGTRQNCENTRSN
jgi:hypothetical protein